ncbi:MAG TPA: nitrate ABC transporter permease [Alphaproteobacteria bacterium]|jgi:NitT/TauT family transport system substrate-binding protein|nr:nitrate ABC transporter permease [Alphaproteobacteria bacterium]
MKHVSKLFNVVKVSASTAFLLVGLVGTPVANAADSITFNMSWLPQGSMSGVITAIEKGFYSEVGLDVEAVRGYGGGRTTNEIDQGLFEFGYGNPLNMVLNRSKGGKTRIVGAINQHWPAGLCHIRERHKLDAPSDLKGITVGGGSYSPVHVMLPVWLELNGESRDAVTLLKMDGAVVDVSLVEGKIDAAECWLGSNKALIEKLAKQADLTVGFLNYSDFNFDILGSGIVTSDKVIAENPDKVRRFVTATYRGYAYANANPEEATDYLLKQFPVLDRDVTLQQVKETVDLMAGSGKLGMIDPAQVQRTIEFVGPAYGIDSVAAEDLYTNDFLQ